MRLFSIVTVLLLWSASCHGINFGRNNNNNKPKRQQQPQDLHDDASTGTVTQLSSSQEDAMTCDAIMAKSLVKANEAKALAEEELAVAREEKTKALDRVSHLQEALTAARTSFDAQVKDMQEDVANVNITINEIRAEANVKVAAAQDEVKKVKLEGEELLKKAQEVHAQELDTMRVENEKQIEEIYAETQANMDKILNETDLKIKRYETDMKEIQDKAKQDVDDMKNEATAQVASMKNETEATIAETERHWEEKNTSLKKESDERIKQLTEENTAVVAAAEKDRNSIKKLMEELGVTTAHQLEEAVEEAKGVLAEKERKFKAQHEEKEMELQGVQKKSKEQEEALNAKVENLTNQLKQVEEDLNERRKELANWEVMHSKRSYCNLTHIGEDTVSVAATAARRAADQAYVAKEKSFRVAKQVAEQATVAAQPGIKKSKELYDAHLKSIVDGKVKPVHEKHVAPVLVVLAKYWRKGVAGITTAGEKTYSFLVASFEKVCPKVSKGLERLNDKMDMAVPSFVLDHVNDSCANPERSVNSFIRAFLFLLALIYRKFLWRTGKKIVLFPLKLLWKITPLRLFIKSHISEHNGNHTGAGVVVKEEYQNNRPPQ